MKNHIEELSFDTDRPLSRRQLLAGMGALGTGAVALDVVGTSRASAATVPLSAVHFQQSMRKLWEDHITWTRLYIVGFAAGLPNVNVTAQRLLRNQVDIGNAIKPFYGPATGNRLTALLKQHILGAVALLQAAKAGNTAQVAQAKAAWYKNANQIADFLHKANPKNWPDGALRKMMHEHLDLTLEEATDELTGNYAGSVHAYDKVHKEILMMADALSAGIIAQFPNRFTS